ncbi:hypothetical protein AAFF_G00393740 [Aldrovandia affinis]|uniref:Uncharacterized protein n=1 Tax=Aldrovandia affinis TaxID=143900 RepID=A0AAD7WL17_9TELE|nr:hypothetical protein AAFF_G00393740 [Aldrovandia affinis]
MKIALPGDLFASVPVLSVLTTHTPEGFVLKRAVRSALIAASSSVDNQHQKVYEAVILLNTSSEKTMYLQLSKRCCTELGLQNDTTSEMEVQFQLNRLQFCEMHKAIDLLSDVERVLPDLKKSCVPVHTGEYPRLNAKQQSAIAFIVGDSDGLKPVAPLLIYGPFGTGKTFTLATAAKELYCHRDGQAFTFPGRSDLDSHRVIITTGAMAGDLRNLKLPEGYFTHILIDEASQMLECEALMPLGLAGRGTRVVLAGDHMQMGPKLFSVDEDQRSNHTLLNRLFHHYQGQKNPVALKSRIIFNENYRSTKEIVDFVSTHFYGKSDAIKASGNVPPHPRYHPLRFHHVSGKCHLDTSTMSWYNLEEVACVVDVVQKLYEEWPAQWGNREPRMICVLSEGSQVVLIRKELRKRRLGGVTVENAENVQGKQFRGVVISTVHTRESLHSPDTICLEFFNDARVMNTVMTRAQSQVIVVGNAAALCSIGKCSRIWKSYIEHCIRKSSAEPQHLTVDCIEQEVEEISRFLRVKCKDVSDVDSATSGAGAKVDEILQQLIEDYSAMNEEAFQADHSQGADRPSFSEDKRVYDSNSEKDSLLEMVRMRPDMYKHGKLVMERFDRGYVMPFDDPNAHIGINGRKNLDMSFNGDEVVVEKSTDEKGLAIWKVLVITKIAESSRSFVCTLEEDDNQKQEGDSKFVSKVMVPLNKNITKIRTLVSKKNRNTIPIYKLDDGNWKIERVCRKARLQGDWLYAQPDENRSVGNRKSHQMIEELMIMFNNSVSEFLIGEKETDDCTPLRCQASPDPELVGALKEKYKDIISMSTHLTYHIGNVEQPSCGESFRVLTSLWKELQSAAKRGDVAKVADLIATDDIHPQLLPATSEFRRLLRKAYVIRANSAHKAKVGHYSLQLDSYTKASSPIRSYLDVILQRLLHAALCHTPALYSPQEIDMLCDQVEETRKKADEYQRKAETFSFAINLKKQSAPKLAFVTVVDPEGDNFKLSFPFDKGTLPGFIPVLYRDLQLEDQPLFDKDSEHMKLAWRRRVYSINTTKAYVELKRLHRNNPCTDVPHDAWRHIVEALKTEKWETAISIILRTKTEKAGEGGKGQSKSTAATKKKDNAGGLTQMEIEHYVDLDLELKPGDTVQVQMMTEMQRGLLMPVVQLLNINEKFEVCLNHARSPIDCFAKYAQHKSKSSYKTVENYARIWKPLCEMESASTAVDENESIIIEDLELTWTEEQKGSFLLSHDFIKDWAIECSLANCYLCIRKRDLKQTAAVDRSEEQVDPRNFTWVAHGVTTGCTDTKKNSKNPKSKQVYFYINHLPMDATPDCVYQKSTKFTVELIPKPLPDVRKESAVNNLNHTNDLVQRIVLGHPIPRGASESPIPRWKMMKHKPPKGLPPLNKSQYSAIDSALTKTFTVIQGPPGTGKTVVGAYIVYWFFVLNSEIPRQNQNPADSNKKEVILYCGPSNKSVDVVAEYLLRFGDRLKPLRVYSRQMEMLEYPYPGSILQLSHKSMRQEQSKADLRPITMHHRMREPENPHWKEIRKFDERIRLGEKLTDIDVEAYKNLLNEARLHELKKHDVILCTCTAASTPNLTKTISARQILIDECAMATEPQALVPLVSFKPEKIVLIGDHKQLRPIVRNALVRQLGMSKSLFERYMGKAVMLDIQYRMHEDICKFPSEESYEGKLKTGVERKNSFLMISDKNVQTAFGHVSGEEVSLVVMTEKGNENSKANIKEGEIAVDIAISLVNDARIRPGHIAILSPYNAQVSEIRNLLKKKHVQGITVSTITKSQGSEWRYVILSTVRSCPSDEIETDPGRAWLSKHVGFVGDPNQINVGITRAQEGLCIIGNRQLLSRSKAWRNLLEHYTSNGCVTMATDITVRKVA